MRIPSCLCLIATILYPAVTTFAADDHGPTTYTLKVRPLATTRPALAHRLLPSLIDKMPGDAAPIYLVAATLWSRETNNSDKPAEELAKKFGLDPAESGTSTSDVFLDAPLARLRSPELSQYLSEQQDVLNLLEVASKRETCHWDMAFREQGFATLLPHLQALRGASRAVCIRARAYLAEGEITQAIRMLQVNFAMCRALNEQAVLIQSLVSASIAGQTLKVLREVQEQSPGVNLYWPLADLPRPMCDIGTGMEWERSSLYFSIPQLRKVKEGTFTDADWRAVAGTFRTLVEQRGKTPSFGDQMEMIAGTVFLYAQARQYFLHKGMTREQVDAIPQVTAIGRYFVESMDEIYDEITKWTRLPYWQAQSGLQRVEVELKQLQYNPVMIFVPAVSRAVFTLNRLDRDIAAMQTVEAIRDYAARHEGKLPATLQEVTDTPIPIDPIWGKPLDYRVEGSTVTLTSARPQGHGAKDELVMKVTFVK